MSHADRRGATTRWVEDDFEYDRRPASRAPPSFLREDYGNPDAGQVVLRERDKTVIEDDSSRSSHRHEHRRRSAGDHRSSRNGERRLVEEDEVLITRPRRRGPSIRDNEGNGEEGQLLRRDRERERFEEDDRTEVLYRERKNGRSEDIRAVTKEEITYKARRQPSPPPVAREREEWVFHHPERPPREFEQVTIRERDRAPPPTPPPPPREQEEIDIRISERDREPPRRPRSSYHEDDIRISERDGRGYREEDIDIRERTRAPSPPRSRYDEEIKIRQTNRDPPRPRLRYEEEDINIRESNRGGRRDEEIDIRRSQSRGPPPSRRGYDEEIDIRESERTRRGYRDEEIDIRERERERARPPPSSYDDEEIRIRDRSRPGYREQDISIKERERSRPRPPPSRYSEEEIDIRERNRHGSRDEEIDIRRQQRSRPRPAPSRYSEEEIDIKERDRYGSRDDEIDIKERERSRRPNTDREQDITIRRRESSAAPTEASRRPRSPEREQNEVVIKRKEGRDGRNEEIIIRRDKSSSPSPEPPAPPAVIHAPTIHQEVVTHHRHIDHGFEGTRRESRAHSPPARTVYDEEIDIRQRGERDGRRYDETLEIDRKVRDTGPSRSRTPLPERRPRERSSPPPPRPRSSVEVDIRRRGERNGESYDEDIRVSDGFRSSRNMAPRERQGAELVVRDESRRYVGGHPVEDRMWTEITKDLVVREALEGCGYEVEETEHYFYVMEYLRYDDVARLVSISDRIRRERKDRIRQMEREQQHQPRRPPGLPAPIPYPPGLAERPWDEERVYERDVYYDKPPAPRPRQSPLPRKETEEVMVKLR